MATNKKTEDTFTEEFKVQGVKVVETVKNLITEGNVRSITIKDTKGKVIAKFPLTIGVLGAALAPILAAIGAIVALISDCTISVEKKK